MNVVWKKIKKLLKDKTTHNDLFKLFGKMENKFSGEYCECGTDAIYIHKGSIAVINYTNKGGWDVEIDSNWLAYMCFKCSGRIPEEVLLKAYNTKK